MSCDQNISAKVGSTTCPFAENVFYEYYSSGSASAITAYSAALGRRLNLYCSDSTGAVVCSTPQGAVVRFPASAVAAYTPSQAQAYRDSGKPGP
ncbi:MAG TPA: hypothetical protein VIM74_02540 [Casimicrobiaceae bacterium]|jgi:hypothetical protein